MVLNGGGSTDIIHRIYMEAVQGAAEQLTRPRDKGDGWT